MDVLGKSRSDRGLRLLLREQAAWRQARDSAGEIDVAAIEVSKTLLPSDLHVSCFRFQGQGFFLTDARMQRGASGAPVVLRRGEGEIPWTLLGVHSFRLDMKHRDKVEDESLGLNCAWYSDVLKTLIP